MSVAILKSCANHFQYNFTSNLRPRGGSSRGGGFDDLQKRRPDHDEDEEPEHHRPHREAVLGVLFGVDIDKPALVDVLAVFVVAGVHHALGNALRN